MQKYCIGCNFFLSLLLAKIVSIGHKGAKSLSKNEYHLCGRWNDWGGARENRGMKKPGLVACGALALIVEYENSILCCHALGSSNHLM